MEKTVLYLIRHGQSEGNLQNVFLGHTDLDLTALGVRQAEITAAYLKGISADAIYSSDLLRALHTARITAKVKGLPVVPDPGLREIDGGAWENVPFDELGKRFPGSFSVWTRRFGACRCDGGESVLEMRDRVAAAVEKIARGNPGKTVFLFTHATPIRVLKATWDGVDLDRMGSVPWPTNSSVTRAEYENGRFTVTEYSTDHFMGDLVTRLDEKRI